MHLENGHGAVRANSHRGFCWFTSWPAAFSYCNKKNPVLHLLFLLNQFVGFLILEELWVPKFKLLIVRVMYFTLQQWSCCSAHPGGCSLGCGSVNQFISGDIEQAVPVSEIFFPTQFSLLPSTSCWRKCLGSDTRVSGNHACAGFILIGILQFFYDPGTFFIQSTESNFIFGAKGDVAFIQSF